MTTSISKGTTMRRALTALATAALLLAATATPAAAFTQYYVVNSIYMGGPAGAGRSTFVDTGIGPAYPGGTNVYAEAYFQQGTLLARQATIRLTYYDKSYRVLCYFSGSIAAGQTFGHNCGVYGIAQVRVFQDINYDDRPGTWSDFYPIP